MSPHHVAPQHKTRGPLPLWLALAGLAAIILLVALVGVDFWRKSQPAPAPSTSGILVNGIAANGRTLGDPNASIAMVEYSDFQ